MAEEIKIQRHIRHTNNTIVFLELNDDPASAAPNLATALSTEPNMTRTVRSIFDKENPNCLLVASMEEAIQRFAPAYYFHVPEGVHEGRSLPVVEHSIEYRDSAIRVPITSQSLCYRILASGGDFAAESQIDELRRTLRAARDNYLRATKRDHPKAWEEQRQLRSSFVAQLTEPVVIYSLLAESMRLITDRVDTSTTPAAPDVQLIPVLKPKFEGGRLVGLEHGNIEVTAPVELPDQPVPQAVAVIAKAELETPLRQGLEFLGTLAKSRLVDDVDPSSESYRQSLVEALVVSGIGLELATQFFPEDSEPETRQLLLGAIDSYDLPKLPGSTAKARTQPSRASDNATSLARTTERASLVSSSLTQEQIRTALDLIRTAARHQFGDDEEKLKAIDVYLGTKTPEGKTREFFLKRVSTVEGESELRGEPGFDEYLALCLNEATELSPFFCDFGNAFRDYIARTLKKKALPIAPSERPAVEATQRQLLDLARATFDDYMTKVSGVVVKLLSLDAFLKTTSSVVERKPHVLVANTRVDKVLDNQESLIRFRDLLRALNNVNEEEYEKAISLCVVPTLDSFHAPTLFQLGFTEGFCTFLSAEDATVLEDTEDLERVQILADTWTSNDDAYKSGVLCLPDQVLLPRGKPFRVGEYLDDKTSSTFSLRRDVVIPACFHAAALVARNDDTAHVSTLVGNDVRLERRWPSLGLGEPSRDKKLRKLWELNILSEGATRADFGETARPFCLLEHSTSGSGQPYPQRIRQLNNLYLLDGQVRPVVEFRVAAYLRKVLRLACRDRLSDREELKRQLSIFCDTWAGIYSDRVANSILDKERYKLRYHDGRGLEIQALDGSSEFLSLDVFVADGGTDTADDTTM